MPSVSVVMSVYNDREHVGSAVRSILDQDYRNFEFIIVNDGSTDGSGDVLDEVRDPRVEVVHQRNHGQASALNRGISMARGEFIARMDADDISLPSRIRKQVQFLERHPKVGLLGTGYIEIDEEGHRGHVHLPPTGDDELRQVLIERNPFAHSSIMLPKEVIEEVGAYDESFSKAQDYDLWFRVARRYELANLEQALLLRRREDTLASVAAERSQVAHAIRARVRAIRRGQYPWRALRHLLKPCASLVTPSFVKHGLRRYRERPQVDS